MMIPARFLDQVSVARSVVAQRPVYWPSPANDLKSCSLWRSETYAPRRDRARLHSTSLATTSVLGGFVPFRHPTSCCVSIAISQLHKLHLCFSPPYQPLFELASTVCILGIPSRNLPTVSVGSNGYCKRREGLPNSASYCIFHHSPPHYPYLYISTTTYLSHTKTTF
jgi:hypothetical protein